MATTADFRNGMTIELDGQLLRLVEFQHVKPGKGGAFVRTRFKNVKTGAVIEKTFRAGEKINEARLERQEVQYQYSKDGIYYFMDTTTFDEVRMREDLVGGNAQYLKENLILSIHVDKGEPIVVELPIFVELAIVKSEPGIRGDTASGGSKPATLETGMVIQVPLFVEEGEVVRIDTRTGKYVERAGR
ncbi:MAG: elongation factor P [Candidatus Eisenbacteria bacterium]|nr:elongation factor P [Candidatus Eisenbacteria bacterium]